MRTFSRAGNYLSVEQLKTPTARLAIESPTFESESEYEFESLTLESESKYLKNETPVRLESEYYKPALN
jgi:hypothetical protein